MRPSKLQLQADVEGCFFYYYFLFVLNRCDMGNRSSFILKVFCGLLEKCLKSVVFNPKSIVKFSDFFPLHPKLIGKINCHVWLVVNKTCRLELMQG